MSDTSIQAAPDQRPAVPPPDATTASPPISGLVRRKHPLLRMFGFLASLRLTVFLFVLALILIFVGTLAQMDAGINAVVGQYFRCFVAWVPFQVFIRFGQVFFGVDKKLVVPGSFPFPGGYIVGSALLINLLSAHLVRFKLSWKRSGILLIHGGLILMLLGELYRMELAVEGNMTIREGESANYLQHRDVNELALITATDDNNDDVVVIPASRLRAGTTVSHALLPFDVEVRQYMPNSLVGVVRGSKFARVLAERDDGALALVKQEPEMPDSMKGLADAEYGLDVYGIPKAQGTGVDANARFDIPSAYVTFKDKKTGQAIGSYFVSSWFPTLGVKGQQVQIDGKTYDLSLRFKRTYKPYSVALIKVTTQFYPGTDTPKDYSSMVRLQDPERKEDMQFKIYMNQPLRYRGETFYQSGVDGVDTTILQVVKNESWLMPYISCIVVGLGMLIHFSMSLSTFLSRRSVA